MLECLIVCLCLPVSLSKLIMYQNVSPNIYGISIYMYIECTCGRGFPEARMKEGLQQSESLSTCVSLVKGYLQTRK